MRGKKHLDEIYCDGKKLWRTFGNRFNLHHSPLYTYSLVKGSLSDLAVVLHAAYFSGTKRAFGDI